MIESLTEEQTARFQEFTDKWTAIGLCIKRANRVAAEEWCRKAYVVAGFEVPKLILWAESPMGLLLTAKLVKEIAAKGLKPYSGVDMASVGASVGDSVRDSGLRNEWYDVGSWGQHDAGWLSFYDYFRHVCGLEEKTRKLVPLTELAKETGWHLFYKNIAILSEKPIELRRNERGQLHHFSLPAIKWADGYELYRFNGISVTKELADKSEFTKEEILGEKNADIRREIVRKIGIEKTVEVLQAKVVDEFEGYKLLLLDIGDSRERPYLQMINPSIGTTHIEGVMTGITTVQAALAWRNGTENYIKPEVLT